MTRVTITDSDGRERVVELDDDQVAALHSLRKQNPFVSSNGRILKESLDRLERGRSSRYGPGRCEAVGDRHDAG